MTDRDLIRTIVRDAVSRLLSESQVAPTSEPDQPPPAYFAPWTSAEYAAHPSQQQFDIAEARSGTSDLLELIEAQACIIEEKRPCDHCGMCRRLGF
jgi:hypothetical protein